MPQAGLDDGSLKLLLGTLKDLGGALITPQKSLEWDAQDVLPEDLIRKLLGPDVGLHLVFLPEDCDGMGGGARDIYRVSEAMAMLDLGVATAFLAIALGSDPLRVGATPEVGDHEEEHHHRRQHEVGDQLDAQDGSQGAGEQDPSRQEQ